MMLELAFLGPIGWPELLIILIIALLIFGRRLPEVMRGLGKSVTEFKRGINEIEADPPPPAAPPAKPAEPTKDAKA